MTVVYLALFLSALYIFWKRAAKTRQKLPPGKCAQNFFRELFTLRFELSIICCHETGPWFKLPVLGHFPLLGANALVEQNVGSVGTFPTGNEVRGCSEFPLKIPLE